MSSNKNYSTLSDYYKAKFNKKVAKIALNANFTCPNKDGKKGFGGCTYCSKLGSGDTAGDRTLSLKDQFYQIKEVMDNKWKDLLYIPYLQSNSNTYGSLDKLKKIYGEILDIKDDKIVGLAIATRPDCFTTEIYDYLGELNKQIPLSIELGLQTSNEQTAKIINRLSTNEEFIDAVNNLRQRNIEVVAHIINGLPYETEKDMMNTIDFLNALDIQGIKFHSLLILKDTQIYEDYMNNPFDILSLEEYTEICVKQIARLRPDIIIHRLAADGVINDIVIPKWPIKKLVVMNEIDKLMRKQNIHQGDDFITNHHH